MNCQEVISTLESSPLRTAGASISDQSREIIDTVKKIVVDTIDDPQAKLKVAILGEVKAGKSLLTNAIAGKELSRVDVLEATSSIIEILYGEGKDNSHHNSSTDSEHIELFCDSPYLKRLTLIDTPGILTVTEENASVTENFMEKADLFLWVF
ncbi:MAG: dynamin family protein [Clostridium sp.]|jgi:predicted GTPase|nr:dynamin family protein [Clostridium sp.]